MSAPSEFEISSLINDLNKSTLADSTKTVYSSIKDGKKPLRIVLNGELTTDGINSKVFQNGTSYTFGLKLTDDEDAEAMNSIITDVVALDGYETTPIVQDDNRMFIKLQLDKTKKKFNTKTNIKIDLKKLDDLDLYRGQNVSVYAEVGAWYNPFDKKAGIFIKTSKIEFEQDEPAKKKKKNKD